MTVREILHRIARETAEKTRRELFRGKVKGEQRARAERLLKPFERAERLLREEEE